MKRLLCRNAVALLTALLMAFGMLPVSALANNTPPRSPGDSLSSDRGELTKEGNPIEGMDFEDNGLIAADLGDVEIYNTPLRAKDVSISAKKAAAVKAYIGMLDTPIGAVGFEEGFDNPLEVIEIIVQFDTAPAELIELAEEGVSEEDAAEQAEAAHQDFSRQLLRASRALGAPVVINKYTKLFNGEVLRVQRGSVERIANIPGVYAVMPNYEMFATAATGPNPAEDDYMAKSQEIFDMEHIWDDLGITGEGVKVGVFDTGIDYRHPALEGSIYKVEKATNPEYKYADYVDGDDDSMETTYKDWQASGEAEFRSSDGSPYYTEHGTHVAGIIHGLAPDAQIYGFRVLGPYGSGLVSGIMQAIEDNYQYLDVMNFSLGSNTNLPYNPECYMMNVATLAGVVCAISAGNNGPGMQTVGTPGVASLPITVAAGTRGGVDMYGYESAAVTNDVTDKNSVADVRLLGWGYNQSFTTGVITTAPGGNTLTKNEDGSYNFVNVGYGMKADFNARASLLPGNIAVVLRGQAQFNDMRNLAAAAGAGALIIINNQGDKLMTSVNIQGLQSDNTIPIFAVRFTDGECFDETGKIKLGEYSAFPYDSDLAVFSSWGPVAETWDIKPDITAPGVQVMSTVPAYITNKNHDDTTNWDDAYLPLDGTSMASPEIAAIAALLVQKFRVGDVNPSPLEVKARLMNTADDLDSRHSVYEVGAGFVNPLAALTSEGYITVEDDIPWLEGGDTKKRDLIKGDLASLSFGISNTADTTRESEKLTATIHGTGWSFSGAEYYNSPLENVGGDAGGGVVTVKSSENPDGTVDLWLEFSQTAAVNKLYEGAALFTKGGKTIRLPFATFYCDGTPIPEPRRNVGLLRPVITSYREKDGKNNIVNWNGWSQFASACVGFDDPLGSLLYTDFYYRKIAGADGVLLPEADQKLYYVDGIDLQANRTWFVYDALAEVVTDVETDTDVRLESGVYELFVTVWNRAYGDEDNTVPGEDDGDEILTTFTVSKFVVTTIDEAKGVNNRPEFTLTGTTEGDGTTESPYTYEINGDIMTVRGEMKSFAHDMCLKYDIRTILYDGAPVYDYRFAAYVLEDVRYAGRFTSDGEFWRDVKISGVKHDEYKTMPNNYALDAYDYDMFDDVLYMVGNLFSRTVALRVTQAEGYMALKWQDDELTVALDKFNDSFDTKNFSFEYTVDDAPTRITPTVDTDDDVDYDIFTAGFTFTDFSETYDLPALTEITVPVPAPEVGARREFSTSVDDGEDVPALIANGAIAWDPPGTIFFNDTSYKATVTLWASGGVPFDEGIDVTVPGGDVDNINVREDGLMMTFDATFEDTESIPDGMSLVIMRVPERDEKEHEGLPNGIWGDRTDNALFFDPSGTSSALLEKRFTNGDELPSNFMDYYTLQVPKDYLANYRSGGLIVGEMAALVPSGVYDWSWVNDLARYFMGYGSAVLRPDQAYYFDPVWYSNTSYGVNVSSAGPIINAYNVNKAYINSEGGKIGKSGGGWNVYFEGLMPVVTTGANIAVFDKDGSEITAPWASNLRSGGSMNKQNIYINFPANNTASSIEYTIKMAKPSGGWFSEYATVTVTTEASNDPRIKFTVSVNNEAFQLLLDSTAQRSVTGVWSLGAASATGTAVDGETYADNGNNIKNTIMLYDYFIPTTLKDDGTTWQNYIMGTPASAEITVPQGNYDVYTPNLNKSGANATNIYSQANANYRFSKVIFENGHDYEILVNSYSGVRTLWVDGNKLPAGALTVPLATLTPATEVAPVFTLTEDLKDNGSPQQAVLSTADYDAAITYIPPDFDGSGKFKADTIYTAHIELTPKNGMSFATITSINATGEGAVTGTPAISSDKIVINYKFGATDPAPQPDKAKIKFVFKTSGATPASFEGYRMAFDDTASTLTYLERVAGNYGAAQTQAASFTDIRPAERVQRGFTSITYVEPGSYDFALIPETADGSWPTASIANFGNYWWYYYKTFSGIAFEADKEYVFNLSVFNEYLPSLTINGTLVEPVQNLNIPLTPPNTGNASYTTITGTGWTGAVTWEGGDPGTFAADSVYKAHVVLTPVDGVIFSGLTGLNVTGAKTVTNKVLRGDTIEFDAEFAKTDPVRENGKAKITFNVTTGAKSGTADTIGITGYRLGMSTNQALYNTGFSGGYTEAAFTADIAQAELFTNWLPNGSDSLAYGESITVYIDPGTYSVAYLPRCNGYWPQSNGLTGSNNPTVYNADNMFKNQGALITFAADYAYTFNLNGWPVPKPAATGVAIDGAGYGFDTMTEPIGAFEWDITEASDFGEFEAAGYDAQAEDVFGADGLYSPVEIFEEATLEKIDAPETNWRDDPFFGTFNPALKFSAMPARGGVSVLSVVTPTQIEDGARLITMFATYEGKTLKTQFYAVLTQYEVTVSAGEGGKVDTEGGAYDVGTSITVKATANEGYRFVGWYTGEGDEKVKVSSAATYTFTVSGDVDLTAVFELIPTYGAEADIDEYSFGSAAEGYAAQDPKTVTVSNIGNEPTGALTVTVTGDTSAFAVSPLELASIAKDGAKDITITPKTGLAPGEYSAVITITGANDISVSFTVSFTVLAKKYAITIISGDNGAAGASLESAAAGTVITLTAVPDYGYRFKEWQVIEGDVAITGNSFTMPANAVTIKAVFEEVPYSEGDHYIPVPITNLPTAPEDETEGGVIAATPEDNAAAQTVEQAEDNTDATAGDSNAGDEGDGGNGGDYLLNATQNDGAAQNGAPTYTTFDPANPPTIDDVPSAQWVLANGVVVENNGKTYIVVYGEDGLVFIFDEDGLPLGYLILKPGQTLDDIDILAALLPLSASKPNPKTDDTAPIFPTAIPMIVVGVAAAVLGGRRKRISK